MKKLMIVLMAAVLIAGCVGQDGGGANFGPGLAITSFTADADSQTSGRDIRLFMEVENQGESTVYTTSSLMYLNGPIGNGLLQWQLMEGDKATKLTRDLKPSDPLKGLPAGTDSIKWRIRVPQMDPGQQKTDKFTARAYYDYETRVNGQITAYSEAESVAARQRGETLQTASFATSSGPLSVSVRSIPDPVTISSGDETVTLEITIGNAGKGTIFKPALITDWMKLNATNTEPKLLYDDLNKINMTVDAGGLKLEGTCNGQQDLIGSSSSKLTCDVTVPMPAAKTSYPIKISLNYGYYIDQPIDLIAVGKR